MTPYSKLCLGLSLTVPIVYIVLEAVLDTHSGSILLEAVLAFCVVPVAAAGAWIWFSDNAGTYVNGFPNLTGDDRNRFANMMGIGVVLCGFVMSLGLALLLASGNMYGILIIILSLIFVFIPIPIFKKNPKARIPLKNCSPKTKMTLTAVISVAVLIPIPVACMLDDSGNEVTVTFNEDSFTVKAPMFDHTFSYKDVNGLALEENFEKGKRIYGYATSEISSGKYRNSLFGEYELASYSKVTPCITFSVNGNMYAFNQTDIEKTQQAYDTLYGHLSH